MHLKAKKSRILKHPGNGHFSQGKEGV